MFTDGGPNSKPSLNTPSIFRPGEFSKWQPQHEAFFTDDFDVGYLV